MANLGAFSPYLRDKAWLNPLALPEGWYEGGLYLTHPLIAAAATPGVVNVDVPGAITWTGQTIGLTTSIAVTPGAITWTGSTIGLKTMITPTQGAITWAGQTVGLQTTITPTQGAITWAGQALGLKTSIGVVAGNITWAGATDIIASGGAPPAPAVADPEASLIGVEGQAQTLQTEGKAILVGG